MESLTTAANLKQYYKWHSAIYDITRWTFLFGRTQLIRQTPVKSAGVMDVLEVGCGTGYNCKQILRHFPSAKLTAVDLSSTMIGIAAKKTRQFGNRVNYIAGSYSGDMFKEQSFDLIYYSYSATMMPDFPTLLSHSLHHLRPGGILAVADFHNTRNSMFRQWMSLNHVNMDGNLLHFLKQQTSMSIIRLKPAYMGLWKYFSFYGIKENGVKLKNSC